MSKIHLRFVAEAVNKDAGAPQTFVLEQVDAPPEQGEGTPYTSSFDIGDTDYGRGLKVYSRLTAMTDGTAEGVEAAFAAHLTLFEQMNQKYAERLGKLRDDAKSGDLWRPRPAAPQQSAPMPPPPLTMTPQTNPPGVRRPATEADRQLPLPEAKPEGKTSRRPPRIA